MSREDTYCDAGQPYKLAPKKLLSTRTRGWLNWEATSHDARQLLNRSWRQGSFSTPIYTFWFFSIIPPRPCSFLMVSQIMGELLGPLTRQICNRSHIQVDSLKLGRFHTAPTRTPRSYQLPRPCGNGMGALQAPNHLSNCPPALVEGVDTY